MLPAKKLDLDIAPFPGGILVLGAAARPLAFANPDNPARFKDSVLFKQLLDPDFAFESLGFGNPRDGYVRGFRLIDETLLQNLQREPLFQLHSGGAENGSDRPCRPALLPDDFTEVALSNS